MKKVLAVVGFLFCVTFLFGKEVRFDLKPKYNVQNGILNEFVFQKLTNNPQYKLSELNWYLDPVKSYGLETTLGFYFFDFNFSFTQVISSDCGYIFDSDWLSKPNQELKTNYSQSTNTIDKGFDLEAGFSGHIEPVNWLLIKPSVNISYTYYSFASKNAFGGYGSVTEPYVAWDDENTYILHKGDLYSIDYDRTTFNVFLGLDLNFNINDKLNIITGAAIAPYNNVNSVDIHWSNKKKTVGTMYNDRMSGFFNFMTANIGLEAKVFENLYLGFNCEYTHIHLMAGYTYTKSLYGSEYNKSTTSYAGCSGDFVTMSFYTIIRL